MNILNTLFQAEKIKIDQLDFRKIKVLTECLDGIAIINKSVNLLCLIIEAFLEDDGVGLYFLLKEQKEANAFKLEIQSIFALLKSDEINQFAESSTAMTLRWKRKGRAKKLKKLIAAKLGQPEISNEAFVNVALMVYLEYVEKVHKMGLDAYLIPSENAGKKVVKKIIG